MRSSRGSSCSLRGFAMLETILAAVLVAMIGTTLVSGLGYVHASQRRQQAQLGAAEVANRIMLQFLDSESSLPSDALPVGYGENGQFRYYWKLDKGPIQFIPDRAGAQAAANKTSGTDLRNLLKLVTVRIWNEQTPNVNPSMSGNPPDFTLARIVNPQAIRNPDSIMKMINSEEGRIELLRKFEQGGG